MAKVVVADSGAIVAALDRRDGHHAWALAQFGALSDALVTCEAVVSESFFLLSRLRLGKDRLCTFLERGIIRIGLDAAVELPDILRLMRRYADTPMSFADACLVRMAETQTAAFVFTTDSDFGIYRRNGRQVIPLIAPW